MTELSVGFACDWHGSPEGVWSGSALGLRRALEGKARVVDVPVNPTGLAGRVVRKAVRELARRGLVTPWPYSRAQAWYGERRLRRGASGLDELLQVNDALPAPRACWLYQDLNYASIEQLRRELEPHLLSQGGLDDVALRRRIALEREAYASARGVFTMSAWLRERLLEQGLAMPHQAVVVGAGINSPARVGGQRPERSPQAVLFVGRDFVRKGGDLVVDAVGILRQRRPATTLTVIGPEHPPGRLPSYVDFRGPQPSAAVAAALDEHDVLAMPSRFEPYGIALAEGLARGLPCVARDAFAMPEIVTDGVDGVLVSSEAPGELADAIERCLDDDYLRDRAWERREHAARRHSWDAVATRLVEEMSAARCLT